DPRKKTQVLRGLLAWGLRHGFAEDGLRILRQSWRDTGMSDADARMWEERLGVSGRTPAEAEATLREGDDGEVPRGRAAHATGAARPARWRGRPAPAADRPPLALMLDWENIKISLADLIGEMPDGRAVTLRPRLAGSELAGRLRDAAWRHGLP